MNFHSLSHSLFFCKQSHFDADRRQARRRPPRRQGRRRPSLGQLRPFSSPLGPAAFGNRERAGKYWRKKFDLFSFFFFTSASLATFSPSKEKKKKNRRRPSGTLPHPSGSPGSSSRPSRGACRPPRRWRERFWKRRMKTEKRRRGRIWKRQQLQTQTPTAPLPVAAAAAARTLPLPPPSR